MKVLVIDDDPVAIAVADAALRLNGYEAELASSGQAAWEAFQKSPVQVVISDWMMPGIDGLELCRRIRSRGGDYTYFVLLTQLDASAANLREAANAGVDDFLMKPVNPQLLWMRMRVAERILNYDWQVKQLEDFLPICSYCHRVRDDKNYWERIEQFLSTRTGSQISHGVCPECYEKVVVPQMRKLGITPPPTPQGGMAR